MSLLFCHCDTGLRTSYLLGCVRAGTNGCLFLEFYRVLVKLRAINPPDRQLFWLFENVSSIQLHIRQTISRFLEVS